MGGINSGGYRRGRRRILAEDCIALDANFFTRQRLFQDGRELGFRWARFVGVAVFDPSSHALLIVFQTRGAPAVRWFNIQSTPGRFGGHRYWLECPECLTRAAKLFAPGVLIESGPRALRFACRQCWAITYSSRNTKVPLRISRRRTARVIKILGGTPGAFAELPPKPKRMRWSTYRKLAATFESERRRSTRLLVIGTFRRFSKNTISALLAPGKPNR